LILDLRWNGGGWDNLTLALASRFTDRERVGFSKAARIGSYDELAEPTERRFAPAGIQFLNKPVMLLISGLSASAAEVQAMILEQLPNVTLIGETTYGIFSNSYGKRLPNGWDLHLSTERYFSHAGVEYEQQGIAPDIEERPNFSDLNSGQDNILERALQEIVTMTSVASPDPTLPGSFTLEKNYPNPFNPSTEISYELARSSHVRLSVFNSLGQKVATLVEAIMPAGRHRVTWHAAGMTSGVYYYSFEAGEFTQTHRMLLLK